MERHFPFKPHITKGRDIFCTDTGTNNAHKVFPADAHYLSQPPKSSHLGCTLWAAHLMAKGTFACQQCFISVAFHSASSETCRSPQAFDLWSILCWKYPLFKMASLYLQNGSKWQCRVISLSMNSNLVWISTPSSYTLLIPDSPGSFLWSTGVKARWLFPVKQSLLTNTLFKVFKSA